MQAHFHNLITIFKSVEIQKLQIEKSILLILI